MTTPYANLATTRLIISRSGAPILARSTLQALLYKYEVDIATAICEVFDDELEFEEDFDLAPFTPSVEGYPEKSARNVGLRCSKGR